MCFALRLATWIQKRKAFWKGSGVWFEGFLIELGPVSLAICIFLCSKHLHKGKDIWIKILHFYCDCECKIHFTLMGQLEVPGPGCFVKIFGLLVSKISLMPQGLGLKLMQANSLRGSISKKCYKQMNSSCCCCSGVFVCFCYQFYGIKVFYDSYLPGTQSL